MKESIYICNFRNNIDSISDYISILKKNSKFTFSSIHQNNDILQINSQNNNCLELDYIKNLKLTCVVENDLFRTVYLEGIMVMWKSLYD